MADTTPAKKKKIAIFEPHEVHGSEKKKEGKVYRKSIFVNIRESMDYGGRRSTFSRQSSAGDLFNRLMSSGYPVQSREWTSRRSTMYMVPRFQNNYMLDSRQPFKCEEVKTMVNRFMEYFLSSYQHNPKRSKRMAENLAVEIKNMIKGRCYDRYRILAVATIGDKNSQDFKASMRFVWDAERDGYVNYAHDAPSFFIIVTVFGVYYE